MKILREPFHHIKNRGAISTVLCMRLDRPSRHAPCGGTRPRKGKSLAAQVGSVFGKTFDGKHSHPRRVPSVAIRVQRSDERPRSTRVRRAYDRKVTEGKKNGRGEESGMDSSGGRERTGR